MKLKEFSDSGKRALKGLPTISINQKGIITFNVIARDRLGLSPGDRITIFQDEDRRQDWYFKINAERGGVLLREVSGTRAMVCNFAEAAYELLRAMELNTTSRFQVATEPIDGLYAIITKSIINKKLNH